MSVVISTIIVNHNAGDFLRRCIDSLLACQLELEIIVVDNASTDGSALDLAAQTPVKLISNGANLGFAAACNIGARLASAPYLLFINPDCWVEPTSLERLLQALRGTGQVGMVGGLLVNPDGSEQAGSRRAIPTPWRAFVRAFGLAHFADRWPRLFSDFCLHKQPLPDHPVEMEAVSGACMMVSRQAMRDVGEWDEGYFLHCEDLDWCMRFRQRGWQILFVPSARITHASGVSSQGKRVFVEWHKHKGMVRFYRKFFRHQYPGPLMPLVALGVWLRFALVASYFSVYRGARMLGLLRG